MTSKKNMIVAFILLFSIFSTSSFASTYDYGESINVNTSNAQSIPNGYAFRYNMTYNSTMITNDFRWIRFTNSTSNDDSAWTANYWYDIRFSEASGVPTSWAELWINVTNLTALVNNTIYAYWGNNSAITS